MRRLALAAAFSILLVTPRARAYDISAEVYVVAEFPKPPPGIGMTEIISFGSVLPNGGRAFDSGQFSHGGALCSPFTGQSDYLCASALARVEIDRIPVQTTSFIGVATAVRLKAKTTLDYRNVTGVTTAQIWAKSSLTIPLGCNSKVATPVAGLNVWYRVGGDYGVTSSDGTLVVTAPRPFETCQPGALCATHVPDFHCPPDGSASFVVIDLWPLIRVENPAGHSGWSVQAVSDYSHTLEFAGIDIVDADGHPVPGLRAVVPDGMGGVNDTFPTAAEYEEIAAGSTTTTTTALSTSTTTTATTTGLSTTTTTSPPCASDTGLAAARCRCDRGPSTCEGVTLRKPIAHGVAGACTAISRAADATGKKQTRLARKAAGLVRGATGKVNGRKGSTIPDACRSGLRDFLGNLSAELG